MTRTATRRMARDADPVAASPPGAVQAKSPSRLDTLAALLARPDGASIADMMAATGWLAHSVRGAMAGALKKRGLVITSNKAGGERHYRTAS